MKRLFFTVLVLAIAVSVHAQDFKASLAKMPGYALNQEKKLILL